MAEGWPAAAGALAGTPGCRATPCSAAERLPTCSARPHRPAPPRACLRRKREKAERREQLKKEGKLLTGKAKEEAERRARAAQQFLKQAGLNPDERACRGAAACSRLLAGWRGWLLGRVSGAA